MQRVVRLADVLSTVCGRYTSYLIVPMIAVIVLTACLRYFFDIAVDWGFETSLFLYGIHGFLGGSYVLMTKGHICVDIVPMHLPARWRRYLQLFSFGVVLAVALIMTWLGCIWAWKSTMIWEHSIHQTAFNPPIWWFKWVVPMAATMVALQAVAEMVRMSASTSEEKREAR